MVPSKGMRTEAGVAYIVLSLTAKALLAWQVFSATLAG
jgi:hypothetical protein